MKTMLMALLSLAVIAAANHVFAKLSASSKLDDFAMEAKTKAAANIRKQADEADKKAAEIEKSGNKPLAELYKKAAECQRAIAAAKESSDKNANAALSKAKKELNAVQQQIRDLESAPVATKKK